MSDIVDAILKLKQLALRSHYYCEDCFYSCPKDAEGSCDSRKEENVCDCGADKHNEEVERSYAVILTLISAG